MCMVVIACYVRLAEAFAMIEVVRHAKFVVTCDAWGRLTMVDIGRVLMLFQAA